MDKIIKSHSLREDSGAFRELTFFGSTTVSSESIFLLARASNQLYIKSFTSVKLKLNSKFHAKQRNIVHKKQKIKNIKFINQQYFGFFHGLIEEVGTKCCYQI